MSVKRTKWEETRPKGCCQCHACGDGEAQGQNYGGRHGSHPLQQCGECQNSARKSVIAITFWRFLGLRLRQVSEGKRG